MGIMEKGNGNYHERFLGFKVLRLGYRSELRYKKLDKTVDTTISVEDHCSSSFRSRA